MNHSKRVVLTQRANRQALFLYEPASFVPLATLQDGHTYWYQCDQIGAPLELTNEHGQIVWAADYKVWGEATVRPLARTGTHGGAAVPPAATLSRVGASTTTTTTTTPSAPLEQPFRFQGQQFDEETGLHYNRFRYYDPGVGRFVTQDPIGLVGGINLFHYAPNSTRWLDPFGLAGYRVSMGNTASQDTLARGVHVNVQGPGLPRSGGHVGIVPTQDGKGLTTAPVDAATKDFMTSNSIKSVNALSTSSIKTRTTRKFQSKHRRARIDSTERQEPTNFRK